MAVQFVTRDDQFDSSTNGAYLRVSIETQEKMSREELNVLSLRKEINVFDAYLMN